MTDHTVSVIGAGVSGLSAAYYLGQFLPGVRIAVFERSDRVGGRIGTELVDGYLVESGPDGFVTHKPAALEFAAAVGLAKQVIHPPPGLGPAYIRRGSRLHRLPDGLSGLVPARLGPLFRSSLLSVPGRVRVAMEPWMPARSTSDESLYHFLARRFGKEAATRLFEPLFGGIYGRTDALSARTTVPQLLDLEREYGSVLRGLRARNRGEASPHRLASFTGGMSVLPERARVALAAVGVQFAMPVAVRGMRMRKDGRRLVLDTEAGPVETDAVIAALPVRRAEDLLGDVAPPAAGILSTIGTTSSAVVSLGFAGRAVRRTLDASGYVVAGSHSRPVTACTWSSVKFTGRAPDGTCLFRLFFGGDGYEERRLGDGALVAMAVEELREAVGTSRPPEIVRVVRHPDATPTLAVGHADRMAAFDSALRAIHPPIAIAGNYRSGVGIADAVAAGRSAAQQIAERLRKDD